MVMMLSNGPAAMSGTTNGRQQKTSVTSQQPQSKQQPAKKDPKRVDFAEMTFQQMVRAVVLSSWFDVVASMVIVLNAVCISTEQSLEIHGEEDDARLVAISEHLFLVLYLVELAMRFYGLGKPCLSDRWVQLDILLLILGVTDSWIIDPLTDSSGFGPLLILRMARLLRLAKTARLLVRIHEFWMLVRGLLNSVSVILWTCVILFTVLYFFGSLGLELIAKHELNIGPHPDEDFKNHVNKYFHSLPAAMLTLVQFLCTDDLASIYRPLVDKDWFLVFYFLALIMIVSVLLVNLITAVILSSTLEQNNSEQDAIKATLKEEWTRRLGDLRSLFERLDQDKSGLIDRDEIMNLKEEDKEMLCEALEVEEAKQIFDKLDPKKKGIVSLQEFSDKILDMVVGKGPVDLKRMERQIETMSWRLRDLFSKQLDHAPGRMDRLDSMRRQKSGYPDSGDGITVQARSDGNWSKADGLHNMDHRDVSLPSAGRLEMDDSSLLAARFQDIWKASMSEMRLLIRSSLQEVLCDAGDVGSSSNASSTIQLHALAQRREGCQKFEAKAAVNKGSPLNGAAENKARAQPDEGFSDSNGAGIGKAKRTPKGNRSGKSNEPSSFKDMLYAASIAEQADGTPTAVQAKTARSRDDSSNGRVSGGSNSRRASQSL
mmetsp:Transcript_18784/g.41954  ORF Transcript_18784/g.41954 Transcript_18784/m.41954 type:complete len:657 (+) Transcript_18784:76-2046(+)